nr:ribonuclease H-like domain-containing protein [Tanacetum cinerariifolium]
LQNYINKQTEEGNTEPRTLENFGLIAGIRHESDTDLQGAVVSANSIISADGSVPAGTVAPAAVNPSSETEFALMVRTKRGLGLHKYIGEEEMGIDDSVFSIFHTNSDDLEGQPIYNRFASVDHMKAVPPPLTGNYMPPSNIPDIDESHMVYGKKATDSSEITTNDDSISHSHDSVLFYFSDRSSNPSTNDFQMCDSSQECSRPNHSNHDSNDSISSVSAPVSESSDTIVTDCARQEDFPSVCPSSIETDVKSFKTLCNKFGSFNKGSHFRKHKSCYVCGSYLHLIKDCDLHEQRLVKRHAKGKEILGRRPTEKTVNPNKPKPVSTGKPKPVSAGKPKPVSAGKQKPVSAGNPKPVFAGQQNTVSAGPPNPVYAGDGLFGPRPLNIQPTSWPWTKYGTLKTKGSKINGGSKSKSWSFAKGPLGRPKFEKAKDRGIVDSGCSRSMSGNKDKLEDFEAFDGGEVTFGGSSGKISRKGTIKTETLNFENVLYVEELQHFNLISVSQICDQTHRVLFAENECLVLSKDFPLPDPHMVILYIPRKHNLYTFSLNELAPQGPLTYLIAKASQNESTIWHRRLGHVNFRNINKLGIQRDYSNPRTPQQNGVAERKNQTLIEAARTMLANSYLPIIFWTEAVATACYVLNRVLVTKPHAKTPYELLTGNKPSISYLKPFGCHVTILNTSDSLGKFDKKSDEGYIVGYSISSKAYRVYNLVSRKIEETMNLIFLENKPFVAGTGQAWMFDIDYLTDSLNYSRVSSTNLTAGNQSEKSSNVGSQEDDSDLDDEPDVLIIHSTPTLMVPIVDEAIIQHGTEEADPLGLTPPMSPCVSLISADRPSISAGKSHVLAVRPSISTDRPISTGIPVSAGRPSCSAARTPIPADIHDTLTIFDCLKSGIFTYSSYDKDFSGPDANNSESSFDVNSIITKNKARLVAQGHRQEEGIDYTDVFAHVARIEAIRLFLAFASFIGFKVYQMDVKSAFLYGKIAEEVYVTQPKSFEDPDHPKKVYKVIKALSMIRCLMYLTATRPDIMFAVCAAARHQVTPKTSNLLSVKRIFKYLTAYPKLGLWYPRDSPFDLEAFSDSDYAAAHRDRKSTTGGCQFLGRRNTNEKKLIQVLQIPTKHNVADLLTKSFDVTRFGYLVVHIEIFTGLQAIGYATKGKFTFFKHKFSPQWKFLIHTLIHCLSPKSGSWNQFASNIATALICLSTGRKYNFSNMIFNGEPAVVQTQPQEVSSPSPYHVVEPHPSTDPMHSPPRQSSPPPILFVLETITTPIRDDDTGGGSFSERPPSPSLATLTRSPTVGVTEEPLTLNSLLALFPTYLQRIATFEAELKATKILHRDAVVLFAKGIKKLESKLKTKTRKLVLSDSEDEEDVRQSQELAALLDLANAALHEPTLSDVAIPAVDPDSAVRVDSSDDLVSVGADYAVRVDSADDLVSASADYTDHVVSAGGADSTGTFIFAGTSVDVGPSVPAATSSPIRDPAKGKAIATPSSPVPAPSAKELAYQQATILEAERQELLEVAEEQERESKVSAAQSTQRQARLDRIALNLTNEEWIGLVDQVWANQNLSAELFGADVSDDTFATRMVDLMNQRRKAIAEMKEKGGHGKMFEDCMMINFRMYMTKSKEWLTLIMLKLIITISRVPADTPIAAGVPTTAAASGSTEPIVPLRKSSKKKSMARKRTLPSPSKSESTTLPFHEDDPEAEFKKYLRQVSDDDEPAEPVSLALVSDVRTWEIIPTEFGLGEIHVITRADGTVKRFYTLRDLMHWVGRADLMVLYGMVLDKYKLERATGIGLGLWSDLRTLITAREDRDVSIIWDDQDQWEIRSWRFYPLHAIHVLETKAGDIIYMFVDKKYPILPATI